MSVDRKQEIVALADALVKSVGYDGFSYADLSAKLGITKASVHHHFPHKEDLGLALCDSYEKTQAAQFAALEAQGGSAWDKLERWLRMGGDLVRDHGKNCPVAALKGQMHTLPPAVQARLKALDEQELGFFTRVLEAGRASGEFAFKGEASAEAALMACAYKGALAFARVQGCAFFARILSQMKRSLTA